MQRYLDLYRDELNELTTRHLLAIFRQSNAWFVTSDSWLWCDRIDDEEEEPLYVVLERHNLQVRHLQHKVKEILDTRPHLPNSYESRHDHDRRQGRREKKVMRY